MNELDVCNMRFLNFSLHILFFLKNFIFHLSTSLSRYFSVSVFSSAKNNFKNKNCRAIVFTLADACLRQHFSLHYNLSETITAYTLTPFSAFKNFDACF
jgi:hypothetical protein